MAQVRRADPDLHLLVDGRRVNPVMRDGVAVFHWALPAALVYLVSHAERPSDLGLNQDARLLGYAVTGLELIAGGRSLVVPLDHAALQDGFHDAEGELRWTDGRATLPAALFAGHAGVIGLRVAGFAMPFYRQRSAASRADGELLARFESLGDNCEFGFVQRHFGVEPVGLLRWAATDAARLVLGLCTGFEGLGDPGATTLHWVADPPEYKLRDRRYMSTHTWVSERTDDPARAAQLHHAGCARLRLLRRKLLADIAQARRIFVFKSSGWDTKPDHFAAVHAALRRIGPAPLLCVQRAAQAHQVGQVDDLGDGMYVGHIDQFHNERISFAVWRELCATTAGHVGNLG